ncbi:permease [Candidatus Parcubacteria bacterium]|nr:MAG: permease [Candidatus Parcubacteria bacterium]
MILFNPENALLVWINFLGFLKKIIPILVLVLFFMTIVNKFLTEEVIKKHLGESRGLKGFFYTSIAGILISGPPYILYPMLSDFKKKGVTNFHLAVFLYNRNIKIPFIPVMIFYFGLPYTIVVSIYIIVFSYFNGYALEKLVKE